MLGNSKYSDFVLLMLTELGAMQTICVGVVDFLTHGDPAMVTLSSLLKPYPVSVTSTPPTTENSRSPV